MSFFFVHIGYALLLGFVFLMAAECTKKLDTLNPHLLTVIFGSLLLAQFVDIDHYNGDVVMLVRCGMMSDCNDPMYNVCNVQLHRGIFHSLNFFVPFTLVSTLIFVLAYVRKNTLLSIGLLCLFLGIVSHWYLDEILFLGGV